MTDNDETLKMQQEIAKLQQQIQILRQKAQRTDASARELQTVSNICGNLSGSDPTRVGNVLASSIADKLNASRSLVLVPKVRTYAEALQAFSDGSLLDNDTSFSQQPGLVETAPSLIKNHQKQAFVITYVSDDWLTERQQNQVCYEPREGILWQQLRAGLPFSVVDSFGTPLYEKELEEAHLNEFGLVYFIPLVANKVELVGIIALTESAYTDSQETFISYLAPQGARAMQNALLFKELEQSQISLSRQMSKLAMLYDVGRALSVIDNRNRLLAQILGHAASIAKAEKGSIMLFDDNTEELVVQVVKGLSKEIEEKILKGEIQTKRLKRGEGIAGRVAKTGIPEMVNNVEDAETGFIKAQSSRVNSILCVPLLVHQDIIGVLNITNKVMTENNGKFTEDDLHIISQVADQAAVAIHNARLYELAVTDGLTRVYIRRHLFQRLSEELKRSRRYNMPITLIMVDIDFFKRVNDNYGHPCGDRVLQEVARILRKSVRDIDLVGRYGGEEFCLVLPNTTVEGGITVAKRMHMLLEGLEVEWQGKILRISVSAGLANFPEHCSADQSDLIRLADTALYYSKRTGRNRTTIYNPNIMDINDNPNSEQPTSAD